MKSAETTRRYKVLLTQEDGIWLVEADELEGVRSFGRTVSEATRNIREAIAAAENLNEWNDLGLNYILEDDAATSDLQQFREAVAAEAQASVERDAALVVVIGSLRSQGMSYRDIGTVVGLSHQRVAQLDAGAHV
ncbi:MAG: type II toxin-antitoxin system HicB family antitoxin [Acidimicrobiia bacterium]